MGFPLAQARSWLAKRAVDLPEVDRQFIDRSRKVARRRSLRMRLLIGGLALPIALVVGAGIVAVGALLWRNLEIERPFASAQFRPFVLTAAAERALKRYGLLQGMRLRYRGLIIVRRWWWCRQAHS